MKLIILLSLTLLLVCVLIDTKPPNKSHRKKQTLTLKNQLKSRKTADRRDAALKAKEKAEEVKQMKSKLNGEVVTNKQGVRIKPGPSAKQMIHTRRHNTRTKARDAAKRRSKYDKKDGKKAEPMKHVAHTKERLKKGELSPDQKKDYYNKNKKGGKNPHYHPVDEKGEKLEDGTHEIFKGK